MSNNEATQVIITQPQIYLVDSNGASIHIEGEMVVGRSDESDFVVNDPKASRKHAKIWPESDGLQVEDLGSTNGTHHQGNRKQTFRGVDGDTISFPNVVYKLKVELPFAAPAEDLDKTMPMDLSKIKAATQEASPKVEAVPEAPVKAPVKQATKDSSAPASSQQPSVGGDIAGDDKQSAGWWESSDNKSDGTAIFSIKDVSAQNTNLQALLQIGPAVEPRLVIKSGPEAGTQFKLAKGSFVIGKDASCDIQVQETTVSDQHAKLVHDGHTWQLVNLLALNHTMVNDEKIQSVYLNSEDQIRLGSALLVFQLPDNASPKSAPKKSNKKWLVGLLVVTVTAAAGMAYLASQGMI